MLILRHYIIGMDVFLTKQVDRLAPIWWASCLLTIVLIGTGNRKLFEGAALLWGLIQLAWPYAVGQMRAKRAHKTYNKIFCSALVGAAVGVIIIFNPPNNTMLVDYMKAFVVLSLVGTYLLFCIRLARIATGRHTLSNSFIRVFFAAFYWPLWADWIRDRLR